MLGNVRCSNILRAAALGAAFALAFTTFSLAATSASLQWTQLNPANAFPARTAFASAYDPVSKKIVVFGGEDDSGQLSETWTFDGATWTQIETSVAPPARADASMAYDARTHKLILFGGFQGFTLLNDTWMWDGATSTWTQAAPTFVPPAATGPMLFTDPADGHADMFGGYEGRFYFGEASS